MPNTPRSPLMQEEESRAVVHGFVQQQFVLMKACMKVNFASNVSNNIGKVAQKHIIIYQSII